MNVQITKLHHLLTVISTNYKLSLATTPDKHLKEIQGVPKKGIDKKLLVGAAHDFNSQFLNLVGFSISVSFVWCII